MSEIEERHRRQAATMRAWLEGKGFFVALKAMTIVQGLEVGFRKDGVTPKFHHQLSIARLLRTLLPHFMFPEEVLACAFLHDILEDHGDLWTRERVCEEFGLLVGRSTWSLTKKTWGLIKDPRFYFEDLAKDPNGSLVKLADRAHNFQTMGGVFSPEKQKAYLDELRVHFYPMEHFSRRLFPAQYPAYENLKILLRCQEGLIRASLESQNEEVS
jgi:(p)ppGpp synthase/HD superfamily hydrolase